MDRGVFLGRYYPGESPLHRLDPRTKLIAALVLIITGFCAGNAFSLGVCVVAVICLYLIARIPFGVVCKAMAPLMFIVIITVLLNMFFVQGGEELWRLGPLAITQLGCRNAVFFGVRLTMFLAIMCLLTFTTTTLDVTDASEKLLTPLKRVGVPVHELAMMAGIALRFLPQFASEFEHIRQAQTARGARLASARRTGVGGVAALVVPLFSGVFRRADTLAAAMDARCYHGGEGRTHLHPLAFSRLDAIAAVMLVLLLAVVIACSLAF